MESDFYSREECAATYKKLTRYFLNKKYFATGTCLRVVVRYLYTLEWKLTDQLKFSFIKNCVKTKAGQTAHKISKDNPNKSGESKCCSSHD